MPSGGYFLPSDVNEHAGLTIPGFKCLFLVPSCRVEPLVVLLKTLVIEQSVAILVQMSADICFFVCSMFSVIRPL